MQQAYDLTTSEGINAAFMRNHRGEVCITFSDPAYVRSDAIVVDQDSLAVYALMYESTYLIGHISDTMMGAFTSNKKALLTALRPDGTVFELFVPVQEGHA